MGPQAGRSGDKDGGKPSEQILQIVFSSAYKQKDVESSRKTLLDLVHYYPSANYWNDLVNITQSSLPRSDAYEIEINRVKLRAGVSFPADDYVDQAQLLIQKGLPGEAKAVLQQGFDAKVLGTGAGKSRETRLQALAGTQAAQDQKSLAKSETQAKSPEEWVAVAEGYASYGQYAKAIALTEKALAAGGLKNPDLVRLHLGQYKLADGKGADARADFAAVKDPAVARLAALWLLIGDSKS